MNNLDKQYLDLVQEILDNGIKKSDRTGTGTISLFGREIRHSMSDGFPILTTKKIHFKSVVTELLWFLKGDTNIKWLVDNGCNIWVGDCYKKYLNSMTKQNELINDALVVHSTKTGTLDKVPDLNPILSREEFINKIKTDSEFAEKWGDIGPGYGKQWRKWSLYPETEIYEYGFNEDGSKYTISRYKRIDQIANLINDLKTNPDSRRLMVNAWNVGEVDQMLLPPCHYGFQCYTRELSLEERKILAKHESQFVSPTTVESWDRNNIPTRAISLKWNQRSCDFGLGFSYNMVSYSLLLSILAKQVNMVPEEIIGSLGDVHLYLNHIELIKEQLNRMSYELPVLKISNKTVDDISEYNIDDFQLENYQSHPAIKMPLSN